MLELGVWVFVFATAGACVGSFLNVVIYRLPRGMSVARPRRSFCPSCRRQIAAIHNIPVVSWIVLSGRCASCGAAIPIRYFLVEVATAALFAALAFSRLSVGAEPGLLQFASLAVECLLAALIVAITVIDFQRALIPDPLTVPWLPLVVIAVFFDPSLLRGRLFLGAEGEPVSGLAAALMGIAAFSYPALFLDFLLRRREQTPQGEEPKSALPDDDEEFSLALETRWLLPRVLLPALIGAGLFWSLFAGDTVAHPGAAAAIASAAGIGAGLVVVYTIRFVFIALFRKEAMGLGDAKFLALAGGVLGAEGTIVVFVLACALGAVPALGSLMRRLPLATAVLVASALLPMLLLDRVAGALGPQTAVALVLPVPVLGLLWFFRRLRRSHVPLAAMPFGPFLAIATLLLLIAPRLLQVA